MILLQLSDFHLRPRGLSAMGRCETNMLAEQALRAAREFRPRPDAILLSGDLTNNGLAEEYAVLADLLARLVEVPVYVLPGNHDRRGPMREALGHLPGVLDHPRFVQYAVEDLPLRLVVLDTLVEGKGWGELCPERLAWLDATLAAAPDRPTVIAMHHPAFRCGLGALDHSRLRAPEGFAAVVARHPQIRLIVAGHTHRTIWGRVAGVAACTAPGVAHITRLELAERGGREWGLEPPGFLVHVAGAGEGDDLLDANEIVSHTAVVGQFPGPFPFLPDPV
jgi:3',5'-cyclic AMP phosphodiesterase CpdA